MGTGDWERERSDNLVAGRESSIECNPDSVLPAPNSDPIRAADVSSPLGPLSSRAIGEALLRNSNSL